MQNLGDIISEVFYLSGKDKQGGYVSPDDINIACPFISTSYLTLMVNEYEQTKQLSSDLRLLIKTRGNDQFQGIPLTAAGNNTSWGEVPDDYRYHARSSYTQFLNDTCAGTSEYRSVIFVSQAEWDNRRSTSIYEPTSDEPIVLFENDRIYVCPALTKLNLTYIKQAATPVFDYDIISGLPVYLPPGERHLNSTVQPEGTMSSSVEFEFPQECYPTLVKFLVAYFAIGNRSEFNLKSLAQI